VDYTLAPDAETAIEQVAAAAARSARRDPQGLMPRQSAQPRKQLSQFFCSKDTQNQDGTENE